MPLDRNALDQLRHLLRPIANRVVNMVARGVVQLVDDSKKMQLVQLGVLAGETVEGEGGAEHFQAFGLASVPMPGAEHVTLFPNGDRSHPITIVVADRRHRPTGGEPGTVTLHNHTGAKVIMMPSGDIEIQPASGREVLIRNEAGGVDRLVKKSEHDGHTHPPGTFAAPPGGGTVTGVSGGAAAVTGTQALRTQ